MHTCPKCNSRINDAYAAAECPVCGAPLYRSSHTRRFASATAGTIPWEDIESRGVFIALGQTVYSALFQPKAFFTAVSRGTFTRNALLFGVVIGIIAGIGNFFSARYFSVMGLINTWLPSQYRFEGATTEPVHYLIALPLAIVAGLVAQALYIHLMLAITRSKSQPLSATLKVVCYTQPASLLAVIPAIGGTLAFFWGLHITLVGIGIMHGSSKMRVFIALILPLLVLFGLIALIIPFAIGTSFGLLL
jgi:hypothetical protein